MLTDKLEQQPSCADSCDPGTLGVEEARQRILADITPLSGVEKLALRNALGRILAEDAISLLNVPGHTNSAMDGYALNSADLPTTSPREYHVTGTAYAGTPFIHECQSGQCVRIMTGAPIPAGTDTVVMQEQVELLDNNRIRIGIGHRAGQNVRQAGEDIAAGSIVLSAGRRLSPADLGVLASLGIGEVPVRRCPRVAFFSTGDELRSIGEPLGEGTIYDSNRYSLHGMLSRLGVELHDLGVIRDDPAALHEAFQSAAAMADVVITSGGVSVGGADHIKAVLDDIGDIGFWKIAMKPGRPLTFGRLGHAHFFGLPGNPVAVMVTFYQFVQPALQFLASGRSQTPLSLAATCTTPVRKRPGRFEFLRGILRQDSDGRFEVTTTGRQGSGILTSMSQANCFILLPEERGDINIGDTVLVQPFDAFV